MEALFRGLRDFTVEILGQFLPGFLFFFGVVATLIIPIIDIINGFTEEQRKIQWSALTAQIKTVYEISPLGIFTTVIILCYITGMLLSRRRINLVDSISFHSLLEQKKEEIPAYDPARLSKTDKIAAEPVDIIDSPFVQMHKALIGITEWLDPSRKPSATTEYQSAEQPQFGKVGAHLAGFFAFLARRVPWESGYYIQFPYANLAKYLKQKGLSHLAEFVTWNPNKMQSRTKQFIDILKVKVFLKQSESYGLFSRNEAQIRLLAGLFYAFRYIWVCGLFGWAVGFVIEFILPAFGKPSPHDYYVSFLVPFVVWLWICFVEKLILEVFHDLRIREIIYILEAAYFLGCLPIQSQKTANLAMTSGNEQK